MRCFTTDFKRFVNEEMSKLGGLHQNRIMQLNLMHYTWSEKELQKFKKYLTEEAPTAGYWGRFISEAVSLLPWGGIFNTHIGSKIEWTAFNKIDRMVKHPLFKRELILKPLIKSLNLFNDLDALSSTEQFKKIFFHKPYFNIKHIRQILLGSVPWERIYKHTNKNKEFWEKAIEANYWLFEYAPKKYRDCKDFSTSFLNKKDTLVSSIHLISTTLRRDPEFIMYLQAHDKFKRHAFLCSDLQQLRRCDLMEIIRTEAIQRPSLLIKPKARLKLLRTDLCMQVKYKFLLYALIKKTQSRGFKTQSYSDNFIQKFFVNLSSHLFRGPTGSADLDCSFALAYLSHCNDEKRRDIIKLNLRSIFGCSDKIFIPGLLNSNAFPKRSIPNWSVQGSSHEQVKILFGVLKALHDTYEQLAILGITAAPPISSTGGERALLISLDKEGYYQVNPNVKINSKPPFMVIKAAGRSSASSSSSSCSRSSFLEASSTLSDGTLYKKVMANNARLPAKLDDLFKHQAIDMFTILCLSFNRAFPKRLMRKHIRCIISYLPISLSKLLHLTPGYDLQKTPPGSINKDWALKLMDIDNRKRESGVAELEGAEYASMIIDGQKKGGSEANRNNPKLHDSAGYHLTCGEPVAVVPAPLKRKRQDPREIAFNTRRRRGYERARLKSLSR